MIAELSPNDDWSFHIRFAYNPAIVDAMRGTPGCSWSKVSRSWIGRYIYHDMTVAMLKKKELEIVEKPGVQTGLQAFKEREQELENAKKLDGSTCMALTNVPLDPHQAVGSAFLIVGERVLLADAVGLQKTATAINACLVLKKLRSIRKVLYVTLKSCVWQVRDEIHRFSNESAMVMDGVRDEREHIFERWMSGPDMFLVVNYEAIFHYQECFNRAMPDVIIADEVSRTKSWSSQTAKGLRKVKSRYFWAMGATPLENNFDEVFNILRIVNPELLGNLTNFKNYYAKIGYWGEIRGWHAERIKDFIQRIQPYIFKRTNQDIGREEPKTEIKHHWLEMSEEQKRVYNDLKTQSKQKISVGGLSYSMAITVLMKLRETCDFADLGDDTASGASVKLDELVKIVREAPEDDRVIIFTQWERAAERIRDRLSRENISHVVVSGKIKGQKRKAVVHDFQTLPIRALVATDCLSYGMNLQAANRMILFEPVYTASRTNQRVGRIRRHGQTRPITIHNLLCKNTVEEKIIQILARKQGYANLLFDPLGKNVKLTMDNLKSIILGA